MFATSAKRSSKMDSGGGSPDSIASVSSTPHQQLTIDPGCSSGANQQQQQQQQQPHHRGGRAMRNTTSSNSMNTAGSSGGGSMLGYGSNGTLPTLTPQGTDSAATIGFPLWEELDEDQDMLTAFLNGETESQQLLLQQGGGWLSSPGLSNNINISPLEPPPTTPTGAAPNRMNIQQQQWPFSAPATTVVEPATLSSITDTNTPTIPEDEVNDFVGVFGNCNTTTTYSSNKDFNSVPPSTPAVHFYPSSHKLPGPGSAGSTSSSRKPLMCTYHNFTDNNSACSSIVATINNNSAQSTTAIQIAPSASILQLNNHHQQRQPSSSSSSFMQQMQSLLNPESATLQVHTASPHLVGVMNNNNRNVMLPPKPRLPVLSNDTTGMSQIEQHQQQQLKKLEPKATIDVEHLVWIAQLNEKARQRILNQRNSYNNNNSSASTTSASVQQQNNTKNTTTLFPASFPQESVIGPHPMMFGPTPTINTSSSITDPSSTSTSSKSSTSILPSAVNTTSSGANNDEITCDWHQHQQPEQQPETATATITTTAGAGAAESEERRIRRLERNRESARQSRRRKKETLLFLGKKVQKLHDALEEKRATLIVDMEEQLVSLSSSSSENLERSVEMYKRYGTIRKHVSLFQYNTMKETMLPQYHQFLLWISNRGVDEALFTAAKECRPKSSAKMSSKQIGEEIFTSEKNNKNNNKYLECNTCEKQRFWPLLCYEFSFSVEQEDKFRNRCMERKNKIQQQQQRRRQQQNNSDDNDDDESSVNRLASAFALVSKLAEKKGSIHNNYNVVAARRERILLNILTQEQSKTFLKWMEENKQRCTSFSNKNISTSATAAAASSPFVALDQLCDQLERTLNIHNNNNDSMAWESDEEEN